MEKQTISSCATADSVTLYWEPLTDAPGKCFYRIFVDGCLEAQTQHTHYTMTGLQPGTGYGVEVRVGETVLGNCRAETTPRRRRLDVTGFGAVGDGKTMNTAAIQKAIDACGGEEEVYIPAGIYCTGALRLHSNMALYLETGAVLQGSEDPDRYAPRIWSRFEGVEQECYQSLLNLGTLDHGAGPNCRNVLIYGHGTISGGGRALAEETIRRERQRLKDYLDRNADLVASCENENTIPGRVRGRLVNMSNCEDVRITGLTLQNGASWNVHMVYSRNIITDHCVIRSAGIWNGDGWDPDSSENCTLFGCRFATEDDMVAIKSGKNPEGNRVNRPTRHIRIFDCSSAFGHGIAIGSEISGGVEDIKIWDCDIARSSNGIEIKGTPKRGGYVKNVVVKDSTFPRLLIHSVLYNDDGEPGPHPPRFSSCTFERLVLTGVRLEKENTEEVRPIEIEGFDEPGYEAQDLHIRDCVLCGPIHEVVVNNCAGISLENLTCKELL